MAVHEYVGARYVPKFSDLNNGDWDNSYSYEALEIVKYGNDYYTAKKPVPVGVDISDTSYWVMTGNYNGAIAHLEQEIGDLGDLPPILNTSIVEAINSINDFITPQMFGAKGDGITDDTQALQDCFDYSATNKIAVYIPAGIYNHSGLIIRTSSHEHNEYLPFIFGSSSESSVLVHTGSGAAITLKPLDDVAYIDGIVITKIGIKGNANTTIGIDIGRGAFMKFSDIIIRNCAIGINQTNDFWMSRFEDVLIVSATKGVVIDTGSITSISMDNVYVMQSTDTAFTIAGAYMNIGTLGADSCSGNGIYYFRNFDGTIANLACELPNVTDIFKFDDSYAQIGTIYMWRPTLASTQTIIRPTGSRLSINEIRFSNPTNLTSALHIATMYHSMITTRNIGGNIEFDLPEGRAGDNTSNFDYQGAKIRMAGKRPYIGYDRSRGDILNHSPYQGDNMPNGFFTCHRNPKNNGDGTDLDYNTPVKEGDWFIDNNPFYSKVAGWVILEDNTTQVSGARQAPIPIILHGTQPPTYADVPGLCYFYDTIGKPIWWTGTKWVDAAGNTVTP